MAASFGLGPRSTNPRLSRIAAIEGIIALILVLPMYLPPTSDHVGPDNYLVIVWVACATGLGLSGFRHARGWGQLSALAALLLVIPWLFIVGGALIDRVFLHPYVYRFRQSLM